jgi:hypothetical protein
MLELERERWTEWIPAKSGFGDFAAKLERKDEELCLADRFFVASRFRANTLKAFQGNLGSAWMPRMLPFSRMKYSPSIYPPPAKGHGVILQNLHPG